MYGEVYRQLSFDTLLPQQQYRASEETLFHCVMARIANPKSKRGSVRLLEQDAGVSLPLEKVYRMMGQLDDNTISRLLVDDLPRYSIIVIWCVRCIVL